MPPDPHLDFADLCRALTLAERAQAIGAGSPRVREALPRRSAEAGSALGEAGRWRLGLWRALSPFRDEGRFARRLALDGLDGEGFARLLSTAAAAAGAALPERPRWMADLLGAAGDAAMEPGGGVEELEQDLDPFLIPVRPWIQRARSRLRQGLARLARTPAAEAGAGAGEPLFVADEAEAMLAASLPARLVPVLARALVLELHVARHQGLLSGESAAQRFGSFIARLGQRDVAAALLGEYPVMAREVMRELAQWEDGSLELLERLAVDAPLLVDVFFQGRHPGRLTSLDGGAGDRHRGGRAVRVLTFASGARLVYKPRPLTVERHFQELLAWLGDFGSGALRTVEVLDRGAYGWMEFVAAQGCSGPDEVAAFYRRLGGLLAVLFTLEATDCHFENLIAAGGQPVLVDVETLFHPRVALPEVPAPDKRLAGLELSGSLLRVGLLPFLVGASDDFEGVDMSGVAAVAGQPSPQPVLAWERPGTDEMRVVRERMPMPGGLNVPFLDGGEGGQRQEVEAAEHAEELAAGFAAAYRLLAARRAALLDPRGPLARFAGDPIRAVLRPTQLYARLLGESYHPDVLRDALDRDLLFDRLWIGTEDQPELERVIAAEHRDLAAGDVPAFATAPDSADLEDARGARWPDFFAEPALAAVRRRLAAMGEADLGRQLSLLRLSLLARKLDRDAGSWSDYPPVAAERLRPPAALRARLIAAASAAGEWFASTAARQGRHVSWVGLDFRNKRWSLVPAPRDLYVGMPGIALFLGYLAAVTGDERAGELARAALDTLIESVACDAATDAAEPPFIGLMQGAGGRLYVTAHLAALWQDRRLLDAAAAEIERTDSQLAQDEDRDVVAGAAGAIAGLLAAHRAGAAPRALAVAVRCGEHLLGRARQDDTGSFWLTRLATDRALAGCAHGVAGIALALIQLGAASGDARFTERGLAAFAWETAAFWPQLRHWLASTDSATAPPPESSVAMSWCYGAPGIGLARLAALSHLSAAAPAACQALERDVAQALRLTLRRGFGQSHCLCHGDLGNLDFLVSAWRRYGESGGSGAGNSREGKAGDGRAGDDESGDGKGGNGEAGDGGENGRTADGRAAALGRHVRRRAQQVLASIDRDGWRCGTRGGVESLGLMNGIAGIGYGLLRLADSDRVPSVLALAPPAAGT